MSMFEKLREWKIIIILSLFAIAWLVVALVALQRNQKGAMLVQTLQHHSVMNPQLLDKKQTKTTTIVDFLDPIDEYLLNDYVVKTQPTYLFLEPSNDFLSKWGLTTTLSEAQGELIKKDLNIDEVRYFIVAKGQSKTWNIWELQKSQISLIKADWWVTIHKKKSLSKIPMVLRWFEQAYGWFWPFPNLNEAKAFAATITGSVPVLVDAHKEQYIVFFEMWGNTYADNKNIEEVNFNNPVNPNIPTPVCLSNSLDLITTNGEQYLRKDLEYFDYAKMHDYQTNPMTKTSFDHVQVNQSTNVNLWFTINFSDQTVFPAENYQFVKVEKKEATDLEGNKQVYYEWYDVNDNLYRYYLRLITTWPHKWKKVFYPMQCKKWGEIPIDPNIPQEPEMEIGVCKPDTYDIKWLTPVINLNENLIKKLQASNPKFKIELYKDVDYETNPIYRVWMKVDDGKNTQYFYNLRYANASGAMLLWKNEEDKTVRFYVTNGLNNYKKLVTIEECWWCVFSYPLKNIDSLQVKAFPNKRFNIKTFKFIEGDVNYTVDHIKADLWPNFEIINWNEVTSHAPRFYIINWETYKAKLMPWWDNFVWYLLAYNHNESWNPISLIAKDLNTNELFLYPLESLGDCVADSSSKPWSWEDQYLPECQFWNWGTWNWWWDWNVSTGWGSEWQSEWWINNGQNVWDHFEGSVWWWSVWQTPCQDEVAWFNDYIPLIEGQNEDEYYDESDESSEPLPPPTVWWPGNSWSQWGGRDDGSDSNVPQWTLIYGDELHALYKPWKLLDPTYWKTIEIDWVKYNYKLGLNKELYGWKKWWKLEKLSVYKLSNGSYKIITNGVQTPQYDTLLDLDYEVTGDPHKRTNLKHISWNVYEISNIRYTFFPNYSFQDIWWNTHQALVFKDVAGNLYQWKLLSYGSYWEVHEHRLFRVDKHMNELTSQIFEQHITTSLLNHIDETLEKKSILDKTNKTIRTQAWIWKYMIKKDNKLYVYGKLWIKKTKPLPLYLIRNENYNENKVYFSLKAGKQNIECNLIHKNKVTEDLLPRLENENLANMTNQTIIIKWITYHYIIENGIVWSYKTDPTTAKITYYKINWPSYELSLDSPNGINNSPYESVSQQKYEDYVQKWLLIDVFTSSPNKEFMFPCDRNTIKYSYYFKDWQMWNHAYDFANNKQQLICVKIQNDRLVDVCGIDMKNYWNNNSWSTTPIVNVDWLSASNIQSVNGNNIEINGITYTYSIVENTLWATRVVIYNWNEHYIAFKKNNEIELIEIVTDENWQFKLKNPQDIIWLNWWNWDSSWVQTLCQKVKVPSYWHYKNIFQWPIVELKPIKVKDKPNLKTVYIHHKLFKTVNNKWYYNILVDWKLTPIYFNPRNIQYTIINKAYETCVNNNNPLWI